VLSHQLSIINIFKVHFLAHPTGNHVSASRGSTVSYKGGIVIEGDAFNHAIAGYNSGISMASDITNPVPVTLGCLAKAQQHSDIDLGDQERTGLFGAGVEGTTGTLACGDKCSIRMTPKFNRGGLK